MEEPGTKFDKQALNNTVVPAAKTFARDYWGQAKEVICHPWQFFEAMPREGGLKGPFLFYLASTSINAVLAGLISFNPLSIPFVVAAAAAGLFLMAAIAMFFGNALGSKAGYEATFRALAYTSVYQLFFWLPAIGAVAILYSCWLTYVALRKVQELSPFRTIVLVCTTEIVTLIVLGLGACAMLFRKVIGF